MRAQVTLEGRPSAAYVDIPSDILFAELPLPPALPPPAVPQPRLQAASSDVRAALAVLKSAER